MTYHNIQNQAAHREIQRLTAEFAILLANSTDAAALQVDCRSPKSSRDSKVKSKRSHRFLTQD